LLKHSGHFCSFEHAIVGVLYITSSYVCFDTQVGQSNQLKLPIRDIVSINKTKYSFLPNESDSSLEIRARTTTRPGEFEVRIFQSVERRDEAVRAIVERAKEQKPINHILVLSDGEPEETVECLQS